MTKNMRMDGKPNRPAENQKLDKKTAKGVFLRLSKYVLAHPYLFSLAIITTLLSNQLALMGPQYSGSAVDEMAREGGVNFPMVLDNIIKMIFCYAVSSLLSYLLSIIMITLSQKIIYTMRKQVFEKLNTLNVSYFDTHATGDIVSRMSYDIDTVNATLSHDLVQVMTSIYTVVGSLIFMWQISKPMLIVVVIAVPISIFFTRYRSKKVRQLCMLHS